MKPETPGRSLVVRPNSMPARVDRVDAAAVLERARKALLDAPPPRVARFAPEPLNERVVAPGTCGATGATFAIALERDGQVLRVLGAQRAMPGNLSPSAGMLSGEYTVWLDPNFSCPHCGSRETMWVCNCPQFHGALHCGGVGNAQGARHCRCTRYEERELVPQQTCKVRGRSIGHLPGGRG